ncbi:NADH dehydrogenase [ubiquinone] 1 alpha subcomplex subunit 1 [Micractinium conductrix]|uniref:NADH dehydrogenase [ubiquinone] 1 alpha subcomplex subunit 1 n=1 Tax=Micractinium conductrix TaxID=554055 RepID=A0A2P6VJW1_9CHLO|nr:NADH dehydrogenase [ubiquinone] 1 alpha subcomplex subunit 1 [Micractinium conductrix]|eukprot:PSC74373.1 NADH dehydrogenase [ubiquinone] 1 alpha subcomplex subunit 1 [Micractinium conductrix]
MLPAWVEACVPLVLIATFVSAMGGLQGAVHHLFNGKPKATGVDEWDRLVAARDAKLLEQWRQKQG